MERDPELFDTDALLHIGRPVWFEKHPLAGRGRGLLSSHRETAKGGPRFTG